MNTNCTACHQAGKLAPDQRFTLLDNLTRDHIYPRNGTGNRRKRGAAYVLAHKHCNYARGGLEIGSWRFERWLRRVMRGDIRPWRRKLSPRRQQVADLVAFGKVALALLNQYAPNSK